MRIGDYMVPPGVFVYVLFHRLHNSVKLWHEPDAFRPERWDTQPAKQAPGSPGEAAESRSGATDAPGAAAAEPEQGSAKAYLPFSEGSRSCVAQVTTRLRLQSVNDGVYCFFHTLTDLLLAAEPCADGAESRACCAVRQLHVHAGAVNGWARGRQSRREDGAHAACAWRRLHALPPTCLEP